MRFRSSGSSDPAETLAQRRARRLAEAQARGETVPGGVRRYDFRTRQTRIRCGVCVFHVKGAPVEAERAFREHRCDDHRRRQLTGPVEPEGGASKG